MTYISYSKSIFEAVKSINLTEHILYTWLCGRQCFGFIHAQ